MAFYRPARGGASGSARSPLPKAVLASCLLACLPGGLLRAWACGGPRRPRGVAMRQTQEAGERRSPWATLGVARGTELADVRRRYRDLAAEWHPDRHAGDAGAAERLRDFHLAYEEVLAEASMVEGATAGPGASAEWPGLRVAAGARGAEGPWSAAGAEPEGARGLRSAPACLSAVGLGLLDMLARYLVDLFRFAVSSRLYPVNLVLFVLHLGGPAAASRRTAVGRRGARGGGRGGPGRVLDQ